MSVFFFFFKSSHTGSININKFFFLISSLNKQQNFSSNFQMKLRNILKLLIFQIKKTIANLKKKSIIYLRIPRQL